MSWIASRTARWAAGAVLLCVLMVVTTWFLLVAPRRAHAGELRDSTVAAQQSNDLLRTRIAQLRVQYAKLPEQRAKLAEIESQLPATDDLSGLLRSVNALAASSGVDLTSVSPGTAAAGAAGVQSIPLSMAVSGDYFQAVAFLRQLQTGLPRAVLVTGLQISQGEGGGSQVQVTVTAQIFTRAGAAAAASAKTPATAAGSGAGSAASAASSVAAGAAAAEVAASRRSRW